MHRFSPEQVECRYQNHQTKADRSPVEQTFSHTVLVASIHESCQIIVQYMAKQIVEEKSDGPPAHKLVCGMDALVHSTKADSKYEEARQDHGYFSDPGTRVVSHAHQFPDGKV